MRNEGDARIARDLTNNHIVQVLLQSDEPAVRYKARVNLLGEDADAAGTRRLQEEIRESPRVRKLLAERDEKGEIPHHPYTKWGGAHWVLALLADLDYPAGDEALLPLREQVYGWLLGPAHQKNIRLIAGRVRRCASQEGNALYAMLKLGLADERADELAARLVQWQWPDGGWNCDRRPEAQHSSFMESLIPLRGLAWHARLTGNAASAAAAERAADIFLKRRLFRRQTDGSVIHPDFVRLHYPCYWHYDILFALKVLGEAGFAGDESCAEARELLAEKRLPDGGFPAEHKFYRVTDPPLNNGSLVDWGGTSKRRMNEFVTVDALGVIGRLTHTQSPNHPM